MPLNNQSNACSIVPQGYLNTKDDLTKKSIVISTEPEARVLTAKIIEVEPYPWLDFTEKSSKKLAPELVLVLNSELQGFSGEKSALYKIWWGRIVQALTIYREDVRKNLKSFMI